MGKKQAVQNAVNAVAVATQAINDYGRNSQQGRDAYRTATEKVTEARRCGATDADLRNTRPA